MTPKEKAIDNIKYVLEIYQIIKSDYEYELLKEQNKLTYGVHEDTVLKQLRRFSVSNPSLDTINSTCNLIDAVLSQALNRDPSLPWIIGVKKVCNTNEPVVHSNTQAN